MTFMESTSFETKMEIAPGNPENLTYALHDPVVLPSFCKVQKRELINIEVNKTDATSSAKNDPAITLN